MEPDLGNLALTDMGDPDEVVLQLLARPLGAGGVKRHAVLVAGKHVMQLNTVRAPDDS